MRLVVLAAAIVLLGLAGMGALVRLEPPEAPVPPAPAQPPVQAAPLPPSPPTRLHIPSIAVDSELVRLGLAADQTLEVPTDFDFAGWYLESPTPGEMGPAVIAGHVDSREGPAVFYRLAQLRPGDEIHVDRADGSVASFRVDRLEQVPKDRFPTQRVYGDVGHAALRLITCGGEFDRDTGHYRDNVVVYASLAAAA